MIRKILLVTCLASFLGGCSEGTSSTGLEGFNGFSLPTEQPDVGAANPVSGGSTTEGSGVPPVVIGSAQPATASETAVVVPEIEFEVSPFVDSAATSSEGFGAVTDSASSRITTRPDFLFDTSRKIQLKIDMPDVAVAQGSLSICTDFVETTTDFDINYQSCLIQATVTNGQYEEDMALMNQFESVVAVIWFRNNEFAPRYRKFNTADLLNGQGWNWN